MYDLTVVASYDNQNIVIILIVRLEDTGLQ
jgi:hypothetical protein